ncbi:MAG: TA system VapC family ribonuclease toxin [Dermatophilaceae bacterium]|nr:PIN domain-containing protein [Intrasporangiaceae bacterium]
MIIDANVLLYAADDTSRHHRTAAEFLDLHLNGDRRIGLPWQSLGAFLRISTHPRIFGSPLSGSAATQFVDDWVKAPAAWVPEVSGSTWSILRGIVERDGVTGNLIPDAQLAALALEYGVPVASADSDFARFGGVDWVNPFA